MALVNNAQNKMIVHTDIGYNGRLGNQLFNYAILLALQLRGKEVGIPEKNCLITKEQGTYDAFHKKWISYRCLLNDIFDLSVPLISDAEINQIISQDFIETEKEYCPQVFELNSSKIKGYFQSYKYFDDIRSYIVNNIKFKQFIIDSMNSKYLQIDKRRIGIHIRLGDSLAAPWVNKLNIEYITNALYRFNQDDYQYMIFSDEFEYCKDWFPDGDVVFVDEDVGQTLYLMTKCNHFIMSPSTLSWWGAYLIKNFDKQIICPKTWLFNKDNEPWTNNLILPEWLTQ